MNNSLYAQVSFYVAGGGILGAGVVLMLIAAAILFNVSKNTSRVIAFLVAALVTVAQMCTTLFFALVSGYGYIPAWASFLISSLLWIPVVMFAMTMLGSAWRSAFLITSVMKKDAGGGSVGAAIGGCMLALKSLVSSVYVVALRHPILYWISSVAAFVFSLCAVIILYGVCFCSNPSLVSTWASRRNEAKFCVPDSTCHVYATVGTNSSRLRVVGHFQSSGSAPLNATVTGCAIDVAQPMTCVGPSWALRVVVLDLSDLDEDPRYVVHGLATNLSGSTTYQFTVTFVSASGSSSSRSIRIRTVPAVDSDEPFSFIGGGDYYSSTMGVEMLAAGVQSVPTARFLLIGGDLSYANNMRSCYLRWDRFLQAVATLVSSEGLNLPLLTIPGNHESGGYLVEPSRSNYFFYTQYLPQYDDDAPGDLTLTYHSHAFGKRFGIIALDSNCMVPIADQVPYLKQQIIAMRGIDATDPTQILTSTIIDRMRLVTVVYHNPMFPVLSTSDDSSGSDPTPKLLSLWLPIIDAQKVSLALEFHEHVYKRTRPLSNGVPAADGVVFIGDGALGVFNSRIIGSTISFAAMTSSTNYVNAFTVFGSNGTVAVQSIFVDSGGVARPGDGTTIARRF